MRILAIASFLLLASSAQAQYSPTTTFSGTITPGDLIVGAGANNQLQDAANEPPTIFNQGQQLRIAGFTFTDGVDATTVSSSNFNAFDIDDYVTASAKGNHVATLDRILVNITPSTPGGYYYVGNWAVSFCNANLGGTIGTPLASCIASNPQVRATSSATYLTEVGGMEVDVEADTGSAPANKIGINITTIGTDAAQGSSTDAALLIGSVSASPAWKNGIAFSNFNGAVPIATSGSVLSVLTAETVAHGINFTNLTCSSDCWKSPGATIDGSGNETVNKVTVSSIPTSAGAGGLYVCVDTSGVTYKKASCP